MFVMFFLLLQRMKHVGMREFVARGEVRLREVGLREALFGGLLS